MCWREVERGGDEVEGFWGAWNEKWGGGTTSRF